MEQKIKRLVVTLAILSLAIFILNLLVDNPYTHGLVRVAINEKVEQLTNLNVDFKAIKVGVIPPSVDLYGVSIATNTDLKRPILTTSNLRTKLSLWSIFWGEIRLSLVEFNEMVAIWPPPWGFPGFIKESGAEKPDAPDIPITWPPEFILPVDRIVLRNASIYYEAALTEQVPLASSYLISSTAGLDIDFKFDSWRDMQVTIASQLTNVAIDGSSVIEDAKSFIVVELVGDKIFVPKMEIETERLQATGNMRGQLHIDKKSRLLDSLSLASDLDVEGDLSLLGTYLELSETRGVAHGKAHFETVIPIEEAGDIGFHVSGAAKIKDGLLDGFRLFNSKTKFLVDNNKIKLSDINIIIGDTSYGTGSGVINFDEKISYDFHLEPNNLRLMDLLDALKVNFDIFDTSITSPNLSIKGTGDPFLLSIDAIADFESFTLPATPYDQSKFPQSPACRLKFKGKVTSEFFDMSGTEGFCFTEKLTTPISADQTVIIGSETGSDLGISGLIHFNSTGLDLTINSSGLNLEILEYFAQTDASGDGFLTTKIYGGYDRIIIDSDLQVDTGEVYGIPLVDLEGHVRIVDKKVIWKNVSSSFAGGGSARLAEGSLTIGDLHIDTKVEAQSIPPQVLRSIMAYNAPQVAFEFGVERLSGQFSGPIRFPLAYQGKIAAQLMDCKYRGQEMFQRLRSEIASNSSGWQARNLALALGPLEIHGSIRHARAFPFDREAAQHAPERLQRLGLHLDDEIIFDFSTKNFDVDNLTDTSKLPNTDHLARLPFVGDMLQKAKVEGQVVLSGKLKGTLKKVQGTFQGGILRPAIFASVLAPVTFTGFVQGSKLDLVLNHAGNALEGRLSMDVLAAKMPYQWYFSFNRMDLRAFATDFFHRDPRNFAYVTATWQMQGHLQDWWNSTGQLNLNDLLVNYVREVSGKSRILKQNLKEPVVLKFTRDTWAFADEKNIILSGNFLQTRVTLKDNRPPENLNVEVESLVDVAISREFSSQVESATGQLRVKAKVIGSTKSPKFSVQVTDLKPNPFIAARWKPVSLGIADLRPRLRNVKIDIVYKDGVVHIDTFRANKGNGTIAANGTLNAGSANQGQESRLDVNLNEATIIYPVAFLKSFEAVVTANLTVSGRGRPYTLSGNVKIDRAKANREVDIRNEIVKAFQRESYSTPIIDRKPVVAFDLNILADKSINIHNRNVQAILSTTLQLSGNDIAPVVGGQLEVNKGRFNYKRDFRVTRGLATFDDPVKPDPSLDIVAVSDVGNHRVHIFIAGRASSPTVEFSIEPPTHEDGTPINKLEILGLLSRGSLPDRNRAIGETASAATSEGLNLFTGMIEEPVEKLFEASGQNIIRTFYVDFYPSEQGPVPRLNLPLDLGENFDIVYRRDPAKHRVSSEYTLHESIMLQGSYEQVTSETTESQQNATAGTSFDLRFRFSFD